jgi:hypothetical protein
MSPAADPRFIPLAEEPRNVEPLVPDARAADGRATLRRPMTAPELAGYLAVSDYCLAPATDEIRRRTPGKAWICWWDILSGMPSYGALREAPSLERMDALWREAFALKVFVDDVRQRSGAHSATGTSKSSAPVAPGFWGSRSTRCWCQTCCCVTPVCRWLCAGGTRPGSMSVCHQPSGGGGEQSPAVPICGNGGAERTFSAKPVT